MFQFPSDFTTTSQKCHHWPFLFNTSIRIRTSLVIYEDLKHKNISTVFYRKWDESAK